VKKKPKLEILSRKRTHQIQTKPQAPDIMTSLLEPYAKKPPTGLELTYLQADARLIIVAGSDTTSATLVYIFYHLVLKPSVVAKLREELEPLLLPDGSIDHREAQHANWLNGVINEALRLHPPVPSAVQRTTPPEGIQIGETYVPGNVNVWCPQYAIGRCKDFGCCRASLYILTIFAAEKAYTDPNSFVPERWFSKPEMIKNKSCFAPFSAGMFTSFPLK
jgi:cytochrome P450